MSTFEAELRQQLEAVDADLKRDLEAVIDSDLDDAEKKYIVAARIKNCPAVDCAPPKVYCGECVWLAGMPLHYACREPSNLCASKHWKTQADFSVQLPKDRNANNDCPGHAPARGAWRLAIAKMRGADFWCDVARGVIVVGFLAYLALLWVNA